MNYANQYQISFLGVNDQVAPKNGEQFFYIKQDAITNACKQLTFNELRLFLYLLSQRGYEQTGKPLWLSPAAANNNVGLAPQSYRDAKTGLIKKGFLVSMSANCFKFIPCPEQEKNDQKTIATKIVYNINENCSIEKRPYARNLQEK